MPSFSDKSEEKLSTCDERLQEVLRTVIQYYDFSVVYGHREKEDQNRLFKEGKSKVQYPNGKHNVFPSLAVDVAPYPYDPNDLPRYYMLAGRIQQVADMLDIPIRFGGDWNDNDITKDNKFNDLFHFELNVSNITTTTSQ